MPDARDRFLDLATLPLAENPEMQIHARRELEEKMHPTAPDAAWQAAANAFERHDRSKWARYAPAALLIIVMIGAAICMTPSVMLARKLSVYRNAFAWGTFGDEGNEKAYRRETSLGLTPDQQLILHGDVSKSSRSERLKALCDRYPENPSYYAEYAAAYASENDSLPPDFLATAERIDPDNGWFLSLAAARLSKDVAKAAKQTTKERKDLVAKKWTISNEPQLEEAMGLLQRASRLPRYESYCEARARERLALVPHGHDVFGQIQRTSFAISNLTSLLSYRYLADSIAAKAEQLGDKGDREGFQALKRVWEITLLRQIRNGSTLVDQLVAQACVSNPILNVRDSAQKLGLEDDASELQKIATRLRDEKESLNNPKDESVDEVVKNHGSLLEGLLVPMIARQVRNPPPLGAAELTPGRRTDHAVGGRIFAFVAIGIMLLISLLCAVHRFRHGLLLRRLSGRLRDVLTPTDWAWILGAVALPSFYYHAIYHLTPLGGKDWGYRYLDFTIPFLQANSWLTLTVVTPILACRWRLQRQFPGLILTFSRQRFACFILLLAFAVIPVAGLAYVFETNELWEPLQWLSLESHSNYVLPQKLAWVLAGALCLLITQVWWLVLGIRAIFGRQERGLGRLLVGRSLIPPYLFALLVIALSIPAYEAQERYWVGKDTMRQSDTSGLHRYEEEVVQVKRVELLEALAPFERK